MKEYIVQAIAQKTIDSFDAHNAPELVRCKDCKHLFDGEHTENCCDVLMEKAGWLKEISVSQDWFCSDGKGDKNGNCGFDYMCRCCDCLLCAQIDFYWKVEVKWND